MTNITIIGQWKYSQRYFSLYFVFALCECKNEIQIESEYHAAAGGAALGQVTE